MIIYENCFCCLFSVCTGVQKHFNFEISSSSHKVQFVGILEVNDWVGEQSDAVTRGCEICGNVYIGKLCAHV